MFKWQMAKHIPKMPFTKKSSSTSSIGVRKKRKKEKEQPIVTSNCNDPVTAEDIQVTAAPAGLPWRGPVLGGSQNDNFLIPYVLVLFV